MGETVTTDLAEAVLKLDARSQDILKKPLDDGKQGNAARARRQGTRFRRNASARSEENAIRKLRGFMASAA